MPAFPGVPLREDLIDPETGLHVVRETREGASGEPVIHEVITNRSTGEVFQRGCLASAHTSVADFLREIDEFRAQQERGRRELAERVAAMSRAERVEHWAGRINFQMRCQSEAGLDLLAVFDASWRAWAESVDPGLPELLPDVCRALRLDVEPIRELLRYERGTAEWAAARRKVRS